MTKSLKITPSFQLEESYTGSVVGVDEAGRGPLAGPVVAAAVIFDRTKITASHVAGWGVNDSKQLTAAKREMVYQRIMESAFVGVGLASAAEIDNINILQATLLAMKRAVEALPISPYVALVDGNKKPALSCKVQTVVKGDSVSFSIAAASIIAKVTRDRIMHELAESYPHYGWHKNAGYGTAVHLLGLRQYGVTPHHRQSFHPVREAIEQHKMKIAS